MAVSKTKHRIDPGHHSTEPVLQSIVFNPLGTVLAAVTVRSQLIDSEIKTDVRFFDWSASENTFHLNTEVMDPHKSGLLSFAVPSAITSGDAEEALLPSAVHLLTISLSPRVQKGAFVCGPGSLPIRAACGDARRLDRSEVLSVSRIDGHIRWNIVQISH